jgi:PAS domain S-box-containing protein
MVERDDGMRLLVVTSDQHDFELVRQQLHQRHRQWTLVQANTLNDGLRKLSSDQFDAVLLSSNLSDTDVDSAYSVVRDQAPHVPILILSNDSTGVPGNVASDCLHFICLKSPESSGLLEQAVRSATRLQQLQSQLDGSERQLRMLAEQLPAMLWTTDETLRFNSMRGRELSIIELREEDIVGKTVDELFADTPAANTAAELHWRALKGESTSLELVWQRRFYHAHVEPLRNGTGDIVGTIGVALDVTGEQKLKRDVHAAHQVQEHLLPSQAPRMKGFDIAGRCFPAEDCSGDFFDFIPLTAGRLALILADVSGHGFGPAILAATIRSYLRMAAVLGNQVHEMLALANRLLLSDGDLTPFASVFAASLDPESRTIRYASAGHPAFLIHFDGKVTRLESLAVPIGVREDEMFTLSARTKLHTGDIVLLSSDGVFETRSPSGEYFGIHRAISVIREHSHEDAEVIVDRLHSAAVEFAGGTALDDDQTMVVVRVIPVTGSVRDTWTT